LRTRLLILSGLLLAGTLRTSAQGNLEFVENKGQWNPLVSFKANIPTGAFFLHKQGFSVLMHNPAELQQALELKHGHLDSASARQGAKSSGRFSPVSNLTRVMHSHEYRVDFVNASQDVEIIPDKPLPTYNNYYLGNDRSRWATGCRVFQGITYKNLYPHVDLRYFTDGGSLKYDLIVHPGADLNKIAMKYTGPDKLQIRNKQLIIKTSVGDAKDIEPYSYQLSQTGKSEVECRYQLSGDNTVKFKVTNYAPDQELIIDPTLVFCTFTGSRSDNWGYTATYDGQGNFYSGSIVLDEGEGGLPNGNGFRVTPGAYQGSYAGGDGSEGPNLFYDVGIMKFNPTGTKVIYATYLGGSGDEQPHSLIVDNSGDLVVAGRTSSSNFPTVPVLPAGLFGSGGGFDIFISKFDPTGTTLIGSRRIGGTGDDGVNIAPKYNTTRVGRGASSLRQNYGDDGRSEVNLDPAGNVYLASCTQSPDFPTVNAFQPNLAGKQDGVVLKLSPDLSNVLFSSFLGGSGDDAAFVLSVDPVTGNVYVGGATASADFPGTKNGPVLYSTLQGQIDGFVSIISPNGSSLVLSSYFGTAGIDLIYGVQFDRNNFPYIMGTTTGNWPITPATVYSQAGGKQFIAKLQRNLSGWVYSTVFGGGGKFPDLSPTAFLVDKCENVYVAGWGGGIDITDNYNNNGTAKLKVTPGAIQSTTDGADFYFYVLKKDGASQLYGTFFGQNGQFSDHVDGGTSRFDRQGIIYEAMCANCYGGVRFPTTLGVIYPNNGTGNLGCNLAAVKIAFNFAGVAAGLKSTINGRPDSSGCISLDVLFSDTIRNAKSYIWNFGDGSGDFPTTNFQTPHTYPAVGTYTVRLIAIDSTSCNVSDTVYMHIRARNDRADLALSAIKLPPCQSLTYQFSNLSIPPAGKPFNATSFLWDFGDNSPELPVGAPSVISHTYASSGTYLVRLLMVDTNYCNHPDEIDDTLRIASLVKAIFQTPPAGCAPYDAFFNNISQGGSQFIWEFGDGSPISTASSPDHPYPNPGTYTITLTAIDSNTCNKIDSTQTTIIVHPIPQAAFSAGPNPPQTNKPTIFNNNSTAATHYKWLFGDGDSALSNTTDTVMHQYEKTGTFNACLIAYNQFNCPDTACAPVQALVNPLLDIPNAFTPGRFGENSIIRVKSFGISALKFRIYNRWGQVVFETNDPNQGWDGNFRGNPQPMDVYAYTLDAQFFDGTRTTRTGDITLIR
jgi:gliding motility-associated-like protein